MGRCDLVIDMEKLSVCIQTSLDISSTGTVVSPLPSCRGLTLAKLHLQLCI